MVRGRSTTFALRQVREDAVGSAQKPRMWISFGVPLVWVVNPENRAIEVYLPFAKWPRMASAQGKRPNEPLLSLTENDILDGGEVLPGFQLPRARRI